MKSTYKAIFFDLFGTLVSVSKAAGDKNPYTADILGLDRNVWSQACFSEAHDILGETDHLATVQRLAHSLDPAIPMQKIRQAAATRQRRFDLALTQVEPEILSALQRLNEGAHACGIDSLLVTYFLNPHHEADIERRGLGSKGAIGHIGDLQSLLPNRPC